MKAAQSGWYRGQLYLIEAKPNGIIKAKVDNKKGQFGTWKAATDWVRDEAERSYNQ